MNVLKTGIRHRLGPLMTRTYRALRVSAHTNALGINSKAEQFRIFFTAYRPETVVFVVVLAQLTVQAPGSHDAFGFLC